MNRIEVAAAALVWLLGLPAAAEDSLVLVDSTGTVLGPVIGRSGPSNHNWVDFLYREGDEFLALSANAAGVFGLYGGLYFQDSNCSGTPFWYGDPFTVG